MSEVAEVKKVEKNLIPAPAPANSPWKSSATVADTDLNVAELLANRKTKSPQPAMKSSVNTKWVPIQVSITVSSNADQNNRRSNSNRKGRSAPKRAAPAASSTTPAANNDANAQVKSKNHHREQANKPQRVPSTKKTESTVEETNVEGTNTDKSEDQQIDNEQQQQQQQQPRTYPNNNRRRFNNSPQHHNNNKQFRAGPAGNTYNSSNSSNSSNNNRHHHNGLPPTARFNKYSNRSSYPHRPNYNRNYNRSMVKIQHSFYPLQPALMAINNVARQIEYYFSDENLAKDEYLKSKLSKDGYAPLELIAKFYRLVNMSFGGDTNIILAALREIVQNPEATVEVAVGSEQVTSEDGTAPSVLAPYFIRAKEFSKCIPETIENVFVAEKILTEGSLDTFMFQLPPPAQPARQPEQANHEAKEQTHGENEETEEEQPTEKSN